MFSPEQVLEIIEPVDPDDIKWIDGNEFDLCFLVGSLQEDEAALLRANAEVEIISGPEPQPPFTQVFRIRIVTSGDRANDAAVARQMKSLLKPAPDSETTAREREQQEPLADRARRAQLARARRWLRY